MKYKNLRDWLKNVEAHGELKKISGANTELEMSSLAELILKEGKDPKPVLMFDDIPGYGKGFRAMFGMFSSPWRIAVTLGLPEDQLDRMSLTHNWHKRSKSLQPIPPMFIASSPLMENSDKGDEVNLLKFPAPRFHELDNPNPYFGTGCLVVLEDPDEKWVNLGTYRVMRAGRDSLALHIAEGHNGETIMNKKYFARGKTMPIAVAMGVNPTLYHTGTLKLAWGLSEYDFAGALSGEPVEVIKGPYTGLPIPANAEIVVEGECVPGELVDEGPFGEARGYYANLGLSPVPEPVIRVKAVHYRNNPILTCEQPAIPPHGFTLVQAVCHSAEIQHALEGAGVAGIKGVWCHEEGCGSLFNVISIEQLYPGHSREVGLIASQIPYAGRYTIVVDDDIDPSNMKQTIWALTTRTTPDKSIQILDHCRSSSADPAIPLSEKKKYKVPPKPLYSSRIVIDACREFANKAEWYPTVKVSPALRSKLFDKWKTTLAESEVV